MDLRCLLWVQNSNISTKIIEKKKQKEKKRDLGGARGDSEKKKRGQNNVLIVTLKEIWMCDLRNC
jgi:hypothetical protein